jgi:hypothetical protein
MVITVKDLINFLEDIDPNYRVTVEEIIDIDFTVDTYNNKIILSRK